jgi:hypothetical protein
VSDLSRDILPAISHVFHNEVITTVLATLLQKQAIFAVWTCNPLNGMPLWCEFASEHLIERDLLAKASRLGRMRVVWALSVWDVRALLQEQEQGGDPAYQTYGDEDVEHAPRFLVGRLLCPLPGELVLNVYLFCARLSRVVALF